MWRRGGCGCGCVGAREGKGEGVQHQAAVLCVMLVARDRQRETDGQTDRQRWMLGTDRWMDGWGGGKER